MPTLTQSKFLNYQNVFYRNVIASPMIVSIGIQVPTPSAGNFLADFTKANSPITGYDIPTWYDFPTLYNRDLPVHLREKTGYTNDEDDIIYLSPLQVQDVFGSFDYLKINEKLIVAKLDGNETMAQLVTHLEPLFGTCIAIEIKLKDFVRG